MGTIARIITLPFRLAGSVIHLVINLGIPYLLWKADVWAFDPGTGVYPSVNVYTVVALIVLVMLWLGVAHWLRAAKNVFH